MDELARMVAQFARNTDLSKVAEVYVEVKKITKLIKDAEERAVLINNRETLFAFPKTDYSQIAKISKDFDPFAKLWATAYPHRYVLGRAYIHFLRSQIRLVQLARNMDEWLVFETKRG